MGSLERAHAQLVCPLGQNGLEQCHRIAEHSGRDRAAVPPDARRRGRARTVPLSPIRGSAEMMPIGSPRALQLHQSASPDRPLPSATAEGEGHCIKRDTKSGRARRGEKRSLWGRNLEGSRPTAQPRSGRDGRSRPPEIRGRALPIPRRPIEQSSLRALTITTVVSMSTTVVIAVSG